MLQAGFCQVHNGSGVVGSLGCRVGGVSVQNESEKVMNRINRLFLAAGALAASALGAHATDSGIPDPSSILTTATTTVTAVCVLVAGVVGFFIVVKIVKWVRK